MSPVVYAIILLIIGVLLVGIEIAIIPGFGLVGVIGAVAMCYGGFIAYENYGALWGVLAVGSGVVLSAVTVYLALKLDLLKKLVLDTRTTGDSSNLPARAEKLVGQTGTAESDLRPSGIARIDGKRTDVVSENAEYIEKGAAVVVTQIDQNSVVVTRHEQPEG